jgi:hypothetical protein
MALDFGAGRAQFDNVQGGVLVEAKDGTRTIHIIVEQRAIADLEGVANTSPGAIMSIYRANTARIHKVASVMFQAGEIDSKGYLRVTSDRLNGTQRKR